MRIAIVNDSRRTIGGVERYLRCIIPELLRGGNQVSLIYASDTPNDRKRIYDGDSWCMAEIGAAATLQKVQDWSPDLIFVNSFSQPAFIEALIQRAPAVFLCHDYVGTCISGTKMVQLPVPKPCNRSFGSACLLLYYPCHCGGWSPATMWRDFRKQTDRQNVLRKGRTLITMSQAMRREYLKHNFDESYVQCIPHPAEMSHFNGKVIPAEPWRLLFSGRMENLKGGSLLIAALPKASIQLRRKLSLVFAGGGRARSKWQSNAEQQMSRFKSVEITFRGWLEPEGLQDLYSQTDLVVMPSIWPEPLGLGALEAAQQQIPTVAFNVGGISEWLQDGHNGCLASGDPPTASGLADAIVRSLAEPAQYKRLCKGAREIACRFTLQNHLSRLTDIFRHATQQAPRV